MAHQRLAAVADLPAAPPEPPPEPLPVESPRAALERSLLQLKVPHRLAWLVADVRRLAAALEDPDQPVASVSRELSARMDQLVMQSEMVTGDADGDWTTAARAAPVGYTS